MEKKETYLEVKQKNPYKVVITRFIDTYFQIVISFMQIPQIIVPFHHS